MTLWTPAYDHLWLFLNIYAESAAKCPWKDARLQPYLCLLLCKAMYAHRITQNLHHRPWNLSVKISQTLHTLSTEQIGGCG